MNREDALAHVRRNGPLPEQPAPGAPRACGHAASSRPCSCHLTPEQVGVAEELADYTLYLFGRPYRGRIKVPHYPSGAIAFEPAEAPRRQVARRPRKQSANPTPPKPDAKREYDRAWRAAKAQGAEALAKFKAERSARKAAA